MAKVTIQVVGGQAKVADVSTVKEAAAIVGCETGHTALINGEPADMDESLSDYEFVSFSKAEKSGQA
jgi:hypothetical protein